MRERRLELPSPTEQALIPNQMHCQHLYFSRKPYSKVTITTVTKVKWLLKAFRMSTHYTTTGLPAQDPTSLTFPAHTCEGRDSSTQGAGSDQASRARSVQGCSHVSHQKAPRKHIISDNAALAQDRNFRAPCAASVTEAQNHRTEPQNTTEHHRTPQNTTECWGLEGTSEGHSVQLPG